MQPPKLRDSKSRKGFELYPLGQIPDLVINRIGKKITFLFAVGREDLDGEDWGDAFAYGIEGEHFNRPIGLADVALGTMAWTVKSVKNENPHAVKKVRVISGRCSPDYSYGISNPHDNVNETGRAVLNIWNERVNIAKENYEPLRSLLLIRNPQKLEFTLFEHEVNRYVISDYTWKTNANGVLEGYHATSQKHMFTWQPHGSQFTVIYEIPKTCKKFRLKKPPSLGFEPTLQSIGYTDDWVEILS